MTASERIKAAEALAVTAEVCGRELSDAAGEFMLSELSEYGLKDVLEALRQCCRQCKRGLFSLADVIERLPSTYRDDRITADDAWGMALKAQAWGPPGVFIAPKAVLMAFPRDTWEIGAINRARRLFNSRWESCLCSYGMEVDAVLLCDRELLAPTLEAAVRDGLLTVEHARRRLPGHDFRDCALLLESGGKLQ